MKTYQTQKKEEPTICMVSMDPREMYSITLISMMLTISSPDSSKIMSLMMIPFLVISSVEEMEEARAEAALVALVGFPCSIMIISSKTWGASETVHLASQVSQAVPRREDQEWGECLSL